MVRAQEACHIGSRVIDYVISLCCNLHTAYYSIASCTNLAPFHYGTLSFWHPCSLWAHADFSYGAHGVEQALGRQAFWCHPETHKWCHGQQMGYSQSLGMAIHVQFRIPMAWDDHTDHIHIAIFWPISYPLVMADIAIENGHRNSEFSHWTWWFSIVFCMFTRPGKSHVTVDSLDR